VGSGNSRNPTARAASSAGADWNAAAECSNRADSERISVDASERPTCDHGGKSLVRSNLPVDGMQKVRGSNPLSSTGFGYLFDY